MALIQVNYCSRALSRTVPVNVILPADRIMDDKVEYSKTRSYKTLYLLHGYFGNYTDWVNGTRIQRYAEENNLAVVMPSGDNSFYLDLEAPDSRYGTFIGRELVEITRIMFPLSRKREDTYIAGLSMGGFGALRNGLKYSGTFSCIAALSSAIHIFDEEADQISSERSIFGSFEEALHSDKNPEFILKKLKKDGKKIPKIYLSCGLQDSLLPSNRKFRDTLISAGADVTYEEEDGGHEWDFWDRQIKKVIDWLPL